MDGINMAIGEQRGVEIGGLFGFAVEPEAGGNVSQGFFFLKKRSCEAA
jgi:hypothetical protein